MGGFSLFHWLIILIPVGVALFFVSRKPLVGPNRFGGRPPAMGFGQAIGSFFKNYVNFSGRASRSEFWYSVLFFFLVAIALLVVDRSETLSWIWSLATFLPGIAVAARRLHDINRSGWWQLLGLVPLIGSVVVLAWYCRASTVDESREAVFA
ncbi:hypothetical protein CO666_31985 [Rhizobium chutanense]|uniref:DUF805 domain-containing protein n=1 Tax=Rhizobium chutanense TaxID=2035448 RepID=A0A2A6J2W1_9HYPH|nr:DUF805 domain-containing protein [Rhizobium chutanense]PDT00197.1 hypothetical protein CO666_31985 [Rhizobium chutanense]